MNIKIMFGAIAVLLILVTIINLNNPQDIEKEGATEKEKTTYYYYNSRYIPESSRYYYPEGSIKLMIMGDYYSRYGSFPPETVIEKVLREVKN